MGEQMRNFTIYRDSWLRGKGIGELFRVTDQRQCCLGQMCSQTGVSLLALRGTMMPIYVPSGDRTQAFVGAFGATGNNLSLAAEINDDRDLSDEQREQDLKHFMAGFGISFEFVDGVAPWLQDAAVSK